VFFERIIIDMQLKKYWLIASRIGAAVLLISLFSALTTANGAFGADPGKRVNRIDFAWAAFGFIVSIYCLYRARKLSRKV